jgi:predicted MPP superfamily phosphohydrolase
MSETAGEGKVGRAGLLRWGLGGVAVAVSYVLATRFLGVPLHAAGIGQPVIGYLNGIGSVLHSPGAAVLHAQRLSGFPPTLRAWLVGLALDVPLYFLLGLLARALWLRARPRAAPAPADPAPNEAPSRRHFLTAGLRLAGGGAVAGLGYAFVEPRWFQVTHRTFPLRGLPPSLEGLRLVQLTDIHHGPWLSLDHVREIVRACNALRPDLVLLTGDYILFSSAYIRPVVEELAQLRPVLGTLSVMGNHDWNEGGHLVLRELADAGLTPLDNTRRVLTPDRELVKSAAEGLALCGVDDLWRGDPDVWRALAGLPPAMPRLVLTHNPDLAETPNVTRTGLRVDLMVCGHTHGGQVYIPGLGTPFVPSAHGQKYAQGLVQGPTCPVFVCRGLGVATVPLRLGVPPEMAVLELRRAPADLG